MIKKLREVRETNGLELDQERTEPTIGKNFKTKFDIAIEYLDNILITDSEFILSDKTSAICITADMSFNIRLETDFKRENQNVEFLFRQTPGLEGMAAPPTSVSQVSGKYLCFLVTRVSEEKRDRSLACGINTNKFERLPGRKRDTRGFNTDLRSKQGQVEP